MKDLRFALRKLSIILPISFSDVVRSEITAIRTNSQEIRILDIGAGSAWYWKEILDSFPDTKISLTLMDAIKIEEFSVANQIHSVNRIVGQVPQDLIEIPANDYDIVVAFNLIEHLPKESGFLLLYEVDRVARRTNIIFTPNGFVWQPPSLNNPFNAHISGWTPRELRKLGFNLIKGHTGLRIFRQPYAQPKKWIKSWLISEIDAFTTIIVWKIPSLAFSFTAVKRAKNPRIEEQLL